MCTAMLILASSAMAQLKNRVPDDGTAVALGSMVKLDASGEISVCGDNDGNVAGIVTAIVPEGATNYYLLAASDIYPARLAASVTAGDRLTTSAGGALRTAAVGEVTIGWALENGHATELRKAIISLDYVAIVDWDTLSAYADTSITNLILDSLAVYLLPNDTILYSDTAGFAWRIPCDSVNECIDWDTLGAYSDTTVTNLILDSLAVYLLPNDTILYSDTAGFAWRIPCDSVNECIDWDTLGAYADTSITNLILDSLAVYLLPNDTILYSDTAGFAWKIPCDSVNECIDWDTLGAYADTSVVWDTLAAYSDTNVTNLILDSLAVYLLPNDTILYSDTAGFAWRIPCDSVNECIDWDTLGAYADTSVVWDTLAAYSDTIVTNLILDSLAVYLLPNDTILYSDTAGFAWRIPCDSVNECIDWDTLSAYLDTTYPGDNLGNHIATQNLRMSGYWVSNDGGNEGLYVDTEGRVGIGTSGPNEDLEVSSSSFTYIRSTTTADADAGVHLRATNVGGEGGSNINQYALFIRGSDNSGDFLINEDYIAGAYAPVTRFIMQNETGNIGIGLGVDDPLAKLHVRGDIFVDNGNGFVGVNPAGTDSFYIYDPGDTTYLHSDNPLVITTGLHLHTVPDDAAPDTILTLSGNQVRKSLASSISSGTGFQQLRVDGNPWLPDSVTFVSGDNITLTQTGDSITFDVDWDTLVIYVEYDTLVAYADTVFVNSVLDSLGAYLDTTNHFFQQLRVDGNPWLTDSVTLISGSGINLTQTGDTITIATAGGSDTDWLRNAAWAGNILYTYNTTDSVAIGLTSATAKLDVDGGITMRGDRYLGIDPSGADSFYIYDDGDTTRFNSDNPIKIGDGSLIVETNGDVIASQKMHVLDMPDTSKVRHVVVVDTTSGQLRTQTFAESVIEATIFSYAEMYETDSSLYDPVVSNTWRTWNSGTAGLSAGDNYIIVEDSLGRFTIGADGGGRYFVMFATSVKAQGANQQYQFAVFKNGTLQPNLNFRMYTTNANGFYGATVSGFLNLVEDDVIDFRFRNLGTTTGVRFYTVNFNMQKVGNL